MEQLKPVGEQVVVLMGASSGIGRESALRFARKGALGSWSRPAARRGSTPWYKRLGRRAANPSQGTFVRAHVEGGSDRS